MYPPEPHVVNILHWGQDALDVLSQHEPAYGFDNAAQKKTGAAMMAAARPACLGIHAIIQSDKSRTALG
ncbi:hypothetical protein J43TS9_06950 [Paenibacillus cineris]|nr:hypothetical protein J43TS9_06950 [Paenibacillus cineris]